MTLNNFFTLIESFATEHYQINKFGMGQIDDLEASIEKNFAYPYLWLYINNLTVNENTYNLDCSFLIFDMLKDDNSNLKDVWSDTMLIGLDLTTYLRGLNQEISLVGSPMMEPFKDRFTHWTAGWNVRCVIELENNFNNCDLPLANLP